MTKYNAINAFLKNKDGEWISPYTADTLKKNQITNCLLEVPQNIKLELKDGALTLKAGSVVNITTGVNTFTQYTIPNDISATCTFSGSYADIVVIYLKDKNQLRFCPARDVNSGATDEDEGIINHIWYDTISGLIKYFNNDTTTPYSTQCSLPLCSASNIGTEKVSFSKINQVFNGFGYIGSKVWVDKGVKCLAPNGRNEDGTLKNIEFETDSIKLTTFSSTLNRTNTHLCIHNNLSISIKTNLTYYEKENVFIGTDGVIYPVVQCAKLSISNGAVTQFEIAKPPFRAVDYNDALLKTDKKEIASWGMPSSNYIDLTLGASGTKYTAPANGWFCLKKRASAANQYIHLENGELNYTTFAHASSNALMLSIPAKKGDDVTISYIAAGATDGFVFIYAEGEV